VGYGRVGGHGLAERRGKPLDHHRQHRNQQHQGRLPVHQVYPGWGIGNLYPGWGIGNLFRANHVQVNGPGHGFFVPNDSLQTVAACDNEVSGAALGFSTIACTPA
jgi:hypothetical protein